MSDHDDIEALLFVFCFGEAFEVPLMQTQIERMPELLIDMHNLVNKKLSRFHKRCSSLLSLSSVKQTLVLITKVFSMGLLVNSNQTR